MAWPGGELAALPGWLEGLAPHAFRPLESARSTYARVSPLSAATAWRGQPRAVVPWASVIVTRAWDWHAG